MNEYERLLDTQMVLIRDLRTVLRKRDASIKQLRTHVSDQKELIRDFHGQIEMYQELLDTAVKAPPYQPRRSRSYNATFWPRLENHDGPQDTGWEDEHRVSPKGSGGQGSRV